MPNLQIGQLKLLQRQLSFPLQWLSRKTFCSKKCGCDKKGDKGGKGDGKGDGKGGGKAAKAPPQLNKAFKVFRYNPDKKCSKPVMEEYKIDLNEIGPMYLDALIKIKNDFDPTFTFRRSCREGICGSCGMNINGRNRLACITNIERNSKTAVIYPLPHMYVIKDLVVNMNRFYDHYAQVEPWLQRTEGGNQNSSQFLQSIKERSKLDNLVECVLCACCSTACPTYWWHQENGFLGPAALMAAYRWVIDSRDQNHEKRLSRLKDKFSLLRCHSIFECANTCPKGLNPARAILLLKKILIGLENKPRPELSTSISDCGTETTLAPLKSAKQCEKK